MKYLRIVFYLLSALFLGVFIYNNYQQFAILGRQNGIIITLVFLLNILAIVSLGQIFYASLKFLGLELPVVDWLGLSVINTLYSYILPFRGGMMVRAAYLKKKFDFNYSNYTSFVASTFIINFVASGLCAVTAGVALYYFANLPLKYLLISAALLAGSLLFALIPANAHKLPLHKMGRIGAFLQNTAGAYRSFVTGKAIIYLLASYIAQNLLMGLRLYYSYVSMGIKPGFTRVFFVQSLQNFSSIISVTPGNLGIRELVIGSAKNIMGVSFDTALSGAIIDRAVGIITIFILGGLYYVYLKFVKREDLI